MPSNYATSLEEVLWGIALVAITVAIHGCGMLATLFVSHTFGTRDDKLLSFVRGGAVLILASWMIVLVHLAELLVWALFFLWQGAMTDASNAYYFSLMQYTTVGSRFSLPPRWRLLDGMLPIAGLMTFAWSTGVLFMLAQEFQSTQLAAIHARRQARRAARAPATRPPAGGDRR
jgi:hypothetical protein